MKGITGEKEAPTKSVPAKHVKKTVSVTDGVIFYLFFAGVSIFTWVALNSLETRVWGQKVIPKLLKIAASLFAAHLMDSVVGSFQRSERDAQESLALFCTSNTSGAPSYAQKKLLFCHLENLEHPTPNSSAFVKEWLSRRQSPSSRFLSAEQLADKSTLERLYGVGRTLTSKKVRNLYNHLIHSKSVCSLEVDTDHLAIDLLRRSKARSTAREYTRERGSIWVEKWTQLRDLWLYGHLNGPSYVQTIQKCLPYENVVACMITSACRSNNAYNSLFK